MVKHVPSIQIYQQESTPGSRINSCDWPGWWLGAQFGVPKLYLCKKNIHWLKVWLEGCFKSKIWGQGMVPAWNSLMHFPWQTSNPQKACKKPEDNRDIIPYSQPISKICHQVCHEKQIPVDLWSSLQPLHLRYIVHRMALKMAPNSERRNQPSTFPRIANTENAPGFAFANLNRPRGHHLQKATKHVEFLDFETWIFWTACFFSAGFFNGKKKWKKYLTLQIPWNLCQVIWGWGSLTL